MLVVEELYVHRFLPSVVGRCCEKKKMLAPVPVGAELASAPALDQAWEAADLAVVSGWAEHPVRQHLEQGLWA